MHPLIAEQIRTVEKHLEELRSALADQQETLRQRAHNQEELQREQFRQRKREVTISHMAEDLESTNKKLALYQTERADLRETLEGVLAGLKGLRGAMTGEGATQE